MRLLVLRYTVCLVGLVACKSKPAPVAANPPDAAPAAAPSASTTPAAPRAADSAPAVSDDDARSFVARWEAAQNARDFATYSGLYAERFMGVKRVGTYSKRFDRGGWLADRKPMFEGGARVRVSELELVASSGTTRAVFTQEFTSTGFRDVGKKELFLVPSAGGLAISREEMLSSQVTPSKVSAESVLAYHRDGAVVERGFDKTKLGAVPKLLSPDHASPIQIGFPVTPEEVSEAARAWLGREVTAYTATGESCRGRVARFEVRVQAVPHFGMRQGWNGELDQPKATADTVARSVERVAQNEEHFVVGVLDRPCAGSWATADAQPFVRAEPVQGELREAAVSAFRALPAYAELQRRFLKESGEAGKAWESVNGELSVAALRAPGRAPVVLVAGRSSNGCAGFSGSLSAFWQVTAESPPQLVTLGPSSSEFVTLRGALDGGARQGLSLLAGPDDYDDELSVLRLSPKPSRHVVLSTAFWDCDC